MTQTTDDATQSPEHGATFEEAELEELTKEQFNKEIQNDIGAMLTQEPFDEEADEIGREERGEEGRVGEAIGGEEEDDEDDEDEEEAYESLEDTFPPEATEELDKDFNPNKEVGMKP